MSSCIRYDIIHPASQVLTTLHELLGGEGAEGGQGIREEDEVVRIEVEE